MNHRREKCPYLDVALLGAQVLAGISQTGIPAPGGGRNLHPSEAELRGFFDELWNNAIRPPFENALSGKDFFVSSFVTIDEYIFRRCIDGCSIISWYWRQWC